MNKEPSQNPRMSLAYLVATGMFSGCSPKSPGTVGTIAFLLIWYLFSLVLPVDDLVLQISIAVFVCVLGLLVTRSCLADLGPPNSGKDKQDPQVIVIDEWAGMAFALCGVSPLHLYGIVSAFLLFRFFDILKPGPVGWAEQLPAEWGIMFDDVIAGILACLCLHLLAWFGIPILNSL